MTCCRGSAGGAAAELGGLGSSGNRSAGGSQPARLGSRPVRSAAQVVVDAVLQLLDAGAVGQTLHTASISGFCQILLMLTPPLAGGRLQMHSPNLLHACQHNQKT